MTSGIVSRVILAGTVGLAAFTIGALAAYSPELSAICCFGGLTLASALRWPLATLVGVLLATQEVPRQYAADYPLLSGGYQLYSSTIAQVPIVVLLAAFTAIVAVGRYGRSPAFIRGPLLAALSLGLCAAITAMGSDTPLRTIVNSDVRPMILLALGAITASTVTRQPGGWRAASLVGSLAMILQLGVGLAVLTIFGQGRDSTGELVLYYNSTFAFVAAAVLLTVVLSRRWQTTYTVLAIAALAVVLLSGRRNVWLAAVIVYAVAILLTSNRTRNIVRAVGAVGIGIAGVAFAAPSLASATTARFSKVVEAVTGKAADVSTQGHVDDIRFGIEYAQQAPFFGYGHGDANLPELVKGGESLYVHNEVVQAWLRYGWVGLAAATIGLLGLVWLGLQTLRRADRDNTQTLGAVVLVMAPISAMTAPFFQTTQQWPIMIGVACALALSPLERRGKVGDQPLETREIPRVSTSALQEM